jgi:glycosyltransferase 2 family protein
MWRSVLLALKVIVSAGLVAVIASRTGLEGYGAILGGLSAWTIVAVVGIVVFQMIVISALRLKFILAVTGCRLPVLKTARITWSGFFIEQVGAAFVTGDILRIWLLRQAEVDLATAIKGPLLDRAVGLATLGALAACGGGAVWGGLTANQHSLFLAAVGILGAVAALLIAVSLVLARCSSRAARAVARASELVVSVLKLLVNRSARAHLTTVAVLALGTHALNVVAMYLLLDAVGLKLSLGTCFVFIPTVLLASMLPTSIAGWGVREGALLLALQNFHLPSEDVVAASVLFGFCVLVASLPGAVIWLTMPSVGGAEAAAWAPVPEPATTRH